MATTDTPKLSPASAGVNSALAWIAEGPRSHVREYGGTFATEFTVLACQLLTYKLAAHFLGRTGFSEYAVARRTISLIYPLPLLGMGIALPRYIAQATGTGSETGSARYFAAAAWCMSCGLLVCVSLMNLFSNAFSYLFFGGNQYANLVLPLSTLVVGLVLHALVYSYFRGNLAMRRANLLQLVNLGIVPLAAFVLFSSSVRSVVFALGIMTTVAATVALAFTPLRYMTGRIAPEAKKLLFFGIPRVPGDFIHMALFTLPVTFVAHERGLQEAGFAAFGISVLNMIASVFTPAGLVLLPKASKMLAEGAQPELRTHVVRIATITAVVATALTVVFELMADPLVRLYLGAGFADVATSVRVMCLGALPFALYCVLRSLVDAYHTKAVNMLNNVIACLAFLFCSGGLLVFHASSLIPVAFLVGIVVLGLLTTREAWRVLAI